MGGLASPDSDFKTYYKFSVKKNMLQWHQGTHIDQWDRLEGKDVSSNIYVQLIFSQSTNTLYIFPSMGKQYSSIKFYWHYWISICKRMNFEYYLVQYAELTQNGSKIWLQTINSQKKTWA